MPTRVVEVGDWIVFPVEQTNSTEIEWYQGKKSQRALYYVDKCWFAAPPTNQKFEVDGNMNSNLQFDKGGTCLIFIAAELIEERTKNHPVKAIKDLHLRKGSDDGTAKEVGGWVYLRVDSFLHYGQPLRVKGGPPSSRWLVYHPGLGKREIFQHRFVSNNLVAIANAGVEYIGDADFTGAGAASKALAYLLQLFSSKAGHELRPFTDPEKPAEQKASKAINGAALAGAAMETATPIDSAEITEALKGTLTEPGGALVSREATVLADDILSLENLRFLDEFLSLGGGPGLPAGLKKQVDSATPKAPTMGTKSPVVSPRRTSTYKIAQSMKMSSGSGTGTG